MALKRATLLIVLTASPALAGGWPWSSRCEPPFQAEYSGHVDHWCPVIAARYAGTLCSDQHMPMIEADRLALTHASPAYVFNGPRPNVLPAPAPAPLPPPLIPGASRPR